MHPHTTRTYGMVCREPLSVLSARTKPCSHRDLTLTRALSAARQVVSGPSTSTPAGTISPPNLTPAATNWNLIWEFAKIGDGVMNWRNAIGAAAWLLPLFAIGGCGQDFDGSAPPFCKTPATTSPTTPTTKFARVTTPTGMSLWSNGEEYLVADGERVLATFSNPPARFTEVRPFVRVGLPPDAAPLVSGRSYVIVRGGSVVAKFERPSPSELAYASPPAGSTATESRLTYWIRSTNRVEPDWSRPPSCGYSGPSYNYSYSAPSEESNETSEINQSDQTGDIESGSEYPPLVAENGSYYGEISDRTGLPRTIYVNAYYRSDGTYVRSYYRSP